MEVRPDLLPISAHAITAMVIRTANATIKVDSLEPAVAQIRLLADRVGGYVANTDMQTGAGQLRSASLELKIPATRFDEALAGLAPIGGLESVNVEAEDVGEEYVDVTARMENARRLERRLIELLANRTGRLKDVLDVEQALARVRQEIERYDGRLRYLRAHQHPHGHRARAGAHRRDRGDERDGRGVQAVVAQLRRAARAGRAGARRRASARGARGRGVAGGAPLARTRYGTGFASCGGLIRTIHSPLNMSLT